MDGLIYLITIACIVVLVFVWNKSHTFRYYAKLSYYNFAVTLVLGVFVIPIAMFRPRDVRNLRPVAWVWVKLFEPFCLDYDLRMGEHMVSDKPYVLVSNHQSSLDVIALLKFLPDRCTALAKRELLYAGTFGFAAWLSGLIFVDRRNRDRARETMSATAQIMHKQNIKLWIYPEGTRHIGDEFLPFKKGAFFLAIDAQVPVVPVVISTYRNFYDQSKKIFEPGKVILQCLPPIPTIGMGPDDVEDLTRDVRNKMLNVYRAVNEEVMGIKGVPELGNNKVD